MLRIIGGKYRHLIIEAPNVTSTRPTTDKVREALMSALSFSLINKDVLDLFAGSGALGLEALSRGAKSATFVDQNGVAVKCIKNNIKKMKIDEEVNVYQTSYMDFLKNNTRKFGVVFLDPPYAMKEVYDEIVNYMFEHDQLTDDAIIIKECDVHFNEDSRFKKFKTYKYGIIHVSVYWR